MINALALLAVLVTVAPSYTSPDKSYATGGGEYATNAVVTLNAYPIPPDHFSRWESDLGEVSYSNPLSIRVPETNVTWSAVFCTDYTPPEDWGEPLPTGSNTCYLTIEVHDDDDGNCYAFGEGEYAVGTTLDEGQMYAVSYGDLVFSGWANKEWPWQKFHSCVIRKNPFPLTLYTNQTWAAMFVTPEVYSNNYVLTEEEIREEDEEAKKKRPKFHVTASRLGELGVVTGSGDYYYGDVCTLRATPDITVKQDNKFLLWMRMEGSRCVQTVTNNPYAFEVYENQNWNALFDSGIVTITVRSNVKLMEGYFDPPSYWDSHMPLVCGYVESFSDSSYDGYFNAQDVVTDKGYYNGHYVYSCQISSGTASRRDISAFAGFGKPDSGNETKIYYPILAKEMNSGKEYRNTHYSPSDWTSFEFTLSSWKSMQWKVSYEVDSADGFHRSHPYNEDWYIKFIRLDGTILRKTSGTILRDPEIDYNLMRGAD